jgi:RNA ligase (TIGR02306 family)
MQRKLASVQRVQALDPIPNADAIELARINGWQCVVKKGTFALHNLGVFLEIDAIPPDHPDFSFLWQPKSPLPLDTGVCTPRAPRPEKFRIRTMKLRGALSQGLLLPLTDKGVTGLLPVNHFLSEGDDLTEMLGVTKWEPPATQGAEARGSFPSFIPKTDEARVQSAPGVLLDIKGLPYAITLKYDGTSATYCIDPRDGEFHACSRNLSVRDSDNVYWRIARQYDLEGVLRRSLGYYAIQGEICGPGIQKNPLGLKDIDFFVFSIYYLPQHRFLGRHEAENYCQFNDLRMVETIERGGSFNKTQEELLQLAEGKYPGTKNEREGIVIRPLAETHSEALQGRLSFKAISNRFLLKGGE